MKPKVTNVDAFDQTYCDRIREAVWDAIVGASRDSVADTARLRNYEIYDALLQLQAVILASSKEAGSPTKTREISNKFAKRLRHLVAELRQTYDRDGLPFGVMHTDELQ